MTYIYIGIYRAVGLAFPIVFNFFVFREVLIKSVLLHSVWKLEYHIVTAICEDTIQEELVYTQIRASVKTLLPEDNDEKLHTFLHEAYVATDTEMFGYIDKKTFKVFLSKINVFISNDKFNLLWSELNYDNSGYISFNDICKSIFPNLSSFLRHKHAVLLKLKKKFFQIFGDKKIPREQWSEEIMSTFNMYDVDKSGYIDVSEFKNMINSLNIHEHINVNDFTTLLNSLRLSDDKISLEQFRSLIMEAFDDAKKVSSVKNALLIKKLTTNVLSF